MAAERPSPPTTARCGARAAGQREAVDERDAGAGSQALRAPAPGPRGCSGAGRRGRWSPARSTRRPPGAHAEDLVYSASRRSLVSSWSRRGRRARRGRRRRGRRSRSRRPRRRAGRRGSRGRPRRRRPRRRRARPPSRSKANCSETRAGPGHARLHATRCGLSRPRRCGRAASTGRTPCPTNWPRGHRPELAAVAAVGAVVAHHEVAARGHLVRLLQRPRQAVGEGLAGHRLAVDSRT